MPGSAHGLWNAGAVIAAERAASAHTRSRLRYMGAASQKRLAESGMHLLAADSGLTFEAGGTFSEKAE